MNLPSFEVYCKNTTGHNALAFDLGNGLRVWFSYRTPVAFKREGKDLVVRENDWGPTTGKHLNAIDGGSPGARKARVPSDRFERIIQLALERGVLVEVPS